jgi:hypothetical protein
MNTNKINDIKQARLVNGTLIIIHEDWINVNDKDIQIDENGRPFIKITNNLMIGNELYSNNSKIFIDQPKINTTKTDLTVLVPRISNGQTVFVHPDWNHMDTKNIQIDKDGRPFQESWGTDIEGFQTHEFRYLDMPDRYKNELQFLLWSTIVGGVALILRLML